MDKVIELALASGMCIEHPDECDVVSHEELTKFYTLARADLEAENAKLQLRNQELATALGNLIGVTAHLDPCQATLDAARAALGEK